MTQEINDKFHTTARTWKNLQDVQNQIDKEKNTVNSPDPLLINQMQKLQLALDAQQASMQEQRINMQKQQRQITVIENNLLRNKQAPSSNGSMMNAYDAKSNYDVRVNNSIKVSGEYRAAFLAYLRTGNESQLIELTKNSTSFSNLGKVDSGYTISQNVSDGIYSRLNELFVMRKLASIGNVSTDGMEILDVDQNSMQVGWAEDGLVAMEKIDGISIKKTHIQIHEIYAQPKATKKLIDDTVVDLEDWIVNTLAQIFGEAEENAFINGNGEGKPKGILKCDDIESIYTEKPDIIDADSIISMYYNLPEQYARNASFLTSRAALRQIRLLKTKDGQYLWQPRLDLNQEENILGCQVFVSPNMPEPLKMSPAVVFGDFKQGYQIVDRQDITILRDPFTQKPYVKFYTTKRVGGGVNKVKALRILKCS